MDYPIQGRNLPTAQPAYHWSLGGVSYAGNPSFSGNGFFLTGSESVQSFRTSKLIGDNIPESTYQGTSGSQVAFEKELREDHVDDDSRAFLKYGSSKYDQGHEFWSEKLRYERMNYASHAFYQDPSWGAVGYDGFILPCAPFQEGLPQVTMPNETKSLDDGSKLFRSAKPTKSEAGLVQFFAELAQKMPELPGGTILKGYTGVTPQTVGSEYLNLEFGWNPTVRDLQKLAKSVLQMHKYTSQYTRDSGKFVRRRRNLPSESWVIEQPVVNSAPILGSFNYDNRPDWFYWPNSGYGVTSVTDVIHTEAWFVGTFTYLVAQGHDFLNKMSAYEAAANHLLGTRFDASTVYELAPFSWLIDWKWDVGNFISNVQALENDELVMKYGYVMHKTSATRTYLKTGLSPKGSAPSTLRTDVTWSQKTRYKASPYGFGPQSGVDSPRKWAILGALGMTLGVGSLRH